MASFEHTARDVRGGADQFALVLGGEDDAVGLEEILLGPGPDGLGVEEQAVVVEEDRVGSLG